MKVVACYYWICCSTLCSREHQAPLYTIKGHLWEMHTNQSTTMFKLQVEKLPGSTQSVVDLVAYPPFPFQKVNVSLQTINGSWSLTKSSGLWPDFRTSESSFPLSNQTDVWWNGLQPHLTGPKGFTVNIRAPLEKYKGSLANLSLK